jgi:hypothetical protein
VLLERIIPGDQHVMLAKQCVEFRGSHVNQGTAADVVAASPTTTASRVTPVNSSGASGPPTG